MPKGKRPNNRGRFCRFGAQVLCHTLAQLFYHLLIYVQKFCPSSVLRATATIYAIPNKTRYNKYMRISHSKDEGQGWLQDWAHQIVSDRVRRGKLFKPNKCADCGVECSPHAHHSDYQKPLDVLWVCRRCHANIHKQILRSKKHQLDNIVYPRAVEIAKSYFM